MPSPTLNAHSAVQAPRKLSWARLNSGLRALLANAAAALPSLLRTRAAATQRRYRSPVPTPRGRWDGQDRAAPPGPHPATAIETSGVSAYSLDGDSVLTAINGDVPTLRMAAGKSRRRATRKPG